jgi:hypothetical protein
MGKSLSRFIQKDADTEKVINLVTVMPGITHRSF